MHSGVRPSPSGCSEIHCWSAWQKGGIQPEDVIPSRATVNKGTEKLFEEKRDELKVNFGV